PSAPTDATAPGPSAPVLPSQARAVYNLVHGDLSGALALTAAAAAAPTPGGAPVPPEVQTAFTALKARVLRDIPAPSPTGAPATSERPAVSPMMLTTLQTVIRAADSRVRDLLAHDIEVQNRLMSASPSVMTAVNRAMDSVEGLAIQCYPNMAGMMAGPSTGTTPAATAPAHTPTDGERFALIRDFLAQRPGVDNAEIRRRVLAQSMLGAIIQRLPTAQHDTILRLVARGTDTPSPSDAIYAAARNEGSADDALAAAVLLAADQAQLQQLSGDLMFRQALDTDRNRAVATVNGLSISVHDYVYRAWGQAPDVGGADPESALATAPVTVGTAPAPPTPEQLAQIGAIMSRAIDAIAPSLTNLGWFDGWHADGPIVEALCRYERECAVPTVRDIFHAAALSPGPELVRRANQDGRIHNLQDRLYHCIGEENRQTVERVLGLRADAAAIGQLGGQVHLASDDRTPTAGHIPMQQALAEIAIDAAVHLADATVPAGTPLGQLVRAAAVDLCRELNEILPDDEDVERLTTNYTNAINNQAHELATQTGVEHISPQELLNNAYRELPDGGGDLQTHMRARLGGERAGGFEHGLVPLDP
ncbi:MAG: hypothetical protein NT062_27540, partial [Proteobacteria bacterium]|nr:hypothetical protein [Pseudomonadota bacterium]